MLKQQEGLFLLLGSTGCAFHEVCFFFPRSTVLRTDFAIYDCFSVPLDGLSALFQIEPGVFSILCYWFPDSYRYSHTFFFLPNQESLTMFMLSLQRLLQTLQTKLIFSTSIKLLTVLDQNWLLEDFFLSKLYLLLSYLALDPAFQ